MDVGLSIPGDSNASEDDDLFFFESDHLALKGNKDYSELLKTIFILEAQRARAVKDYDTVVELHKKALDNPELFLDKIKKGEPLGVPDLQIIAEIPSINWSKYQVSLPEEGLKFLESKQGLKSSNAHLLAEDSNEKKHKHHYLGTHNKPWTIEEQKRLEELLVIYPPEAVEFRRFKKIAAALGNRTVKQVSSRVQKYFLKLYKAGLPIPGRIPKYAERSKKSKLHTHQRHNHFLFKPTTFFPQLDIPVVMNETEDVPGPSKINADPNNSIPANNTNYLLPSGTQEASSDHKTETDIQLEIVQRVKLEKQNAHGFQSTFQHFGYQCDYCSEDPIIGTRWHCETCTTESIDFCCDCIISQMYSDNPHPLSHKLEPISCEDVVTSNIVDSSGESLSGSVFGSSMKNVESSDEEITNNYENDDWDVPDAAQSSLDGYDFVFNGLNNGEENGDGEEGEEDDFNYYNASEKTDSVIYDKQSNEDEPMLYLAKKTDAKDKNLTHEECFTDVQNISYGYLHSQMLLDENLQEIGNLEDCIL